MPCRWIYCCATLWLLLAMLGAASVQASAASKRGDESSDDPFSDDSLNDPGFIPSGSSDNDEYDSDDNVPGPSSHATNDKRSNNPGPSGLSTSKRTRLDRECLIEEEPETEQHRSVEMQQGDNNPPQELQQADIGNRVHPGIVQPTLRDLSASVWGASDGNHLRFDETYEAGIKPEWQAALQGHNPVDYYLAFIDIHILDLIADQTNHYATQYLIENVNISNNARVQKWEPTTRKEIVHFLGLLGYMGIVRMNSIREYWSTKWLFKNDVARNVMSRNRFEVMLKMLHFSDNAQCPEGDRLYKVQPLLDEIIKNYQKIYTPGKTFCIDETMVPFQGRLLFKQYNPQKGHKYGIKIFKLCSERGYTWNMSIYAGKEKENDVLSVSTKIVLKLATNLLGCGRICVTDNWYTSLQLAHILLDQKTHCLGTLRHNRKGNPAEVIKKKLKRGEVIAQNNERGICVLKWRDKRDVLVLSTCHSDEMVQVQRRGNPVQKPKAIIDYNSGKSSIDLSDQMSSYSTALRRTIRWYKKVAIEVLLGTSIVNAHFIFKQVEQSDISITDFRYSVIKDLLQFEDGNGYEFIRQVNVSLRAHVFAKLNCKARENRKYCKGCYKKKQDGLIDKNKIRKVITYCEQCEGNPRYCLECFNIFHKSR